MSQNPITVIVGPTASGKTSAAISLAQKNNGYIISADSRQIYRSMDIGTAKPQGTLKPIPGTDVEAYYVDEVPHFMIDIVNPDENFSLADFQSQVFSLLENKEVNKQFHSPLLVGGTGLYIQSIVDNYVLPKTEPDTELRQKLETMSLEDLQKKLQHKDPDTFAAIDIQNKRRVIRALEFVLLEKTSYIHAQEKQTSPYTFDMYGIDIEKDELHSRIDTRVDQMIAEGLVDEVKNLVEKYDPFLPALSGIGYAEIIDYLNNKISLAKAIEQIKLHTRQYAKRQMTWFKRDKRITWVQKIPL